MFVSFTSTERVLCCLSRLLKSVRVPRARAPEARFFRTHTSLLLFTPAPLLHTSTRYFYSLRAQHYAMKEIFPNDDHYLGITATVAAGIQVVGFLVAYTLQFDKITDLLGSLTFIAIALLALCAAGFYSDRACIMFAFLAAARLELAAFLFTRVLKRGKDARFDEIRTNPVRFAFFWVFQFLWAWVVSLPVIFVASDPASPPLDAHDGVGIAMWGVGFILEVWSDLVKHAFRSNKANGGKVCDVGPWGWSRHPNFFGEVLMWWGLFLMGVPVYKASASSWGYASLASPLLTLFLLLFVSGMPTAEGVNQRRFLATQASKEAFLAYRGRTSPLVPLPPAVYSAAPAWVKRWLLLELPMYAMDWSYCGEGGEGASSTALLRDAAPVEKAK